jgi:quinol monooxygenase YgiN
MTIPSYRILLNPLFIKSKVYFLEFHLYNNDLFYPSTTLDEFLKAWATEAEKFKQQPGFISTQLHRGIGGSGTFVNYAVWESAALFKKAVNTVMNPLERMSAYPASTVASPHLFKKVAVPGICVD